MNLCQVSGAIYAGGPDWNNYTAFLAKVFGTFMWSNPLHVSMFPDVRLLEVGCGARAFASFISAFAFRPKSFP